MTKKYKGLADRLNTIEFSVGSRNTGVYICCPKDRTILCNNKKHIYKTDKEYKTAYEKFLALTDKAEKLNGEKSVFIIDDIPKTKVKEKATI